MTGPAAPAMIRIAPLPVMTRPARPARAGRALPSHPHRFRTEESQP
ncbi:hypothetical protein [Streptomyces sp. SID14515]|nr:hypothetical protein [Streptomyces sp. SID14515]NEB41205.1 hypothetical protein [Streptomyces sp. SID14515]